MLDVLGQNYIQTARSKGLGEWLVTRRHALRNAILPVVTILGLQVGYLMGGTVITEWVFAWPGMGRLIVDSIYSRDYPMTQGAILILSVIVSPFACRWAPVTRPPSLTCNRLARRHG